MQRTMELATLGLGSVSPNPLVGCVIVHEDNIIGEGWHKEYGGPHAEVNAIDSVKNKALLKESTAYVNLEPCAHHGKTPPCADLLISHHIKSVKISNVDANPLVGGKGIARMKENGIEVTTGLLEKEGLELNRRFFTFIQKKRPYIILKWAQTADGFIARENYDSKWISGEESRKLVHKWRSEESGIMVATNTAIYDNPKLDVRHWSGANPTRIVIDKNLKLSPDLNLFDGTIPTICYNLMKDKESNGVSYVKISENELLIDIFNDLYQRGIQSIIVEGGAALHRSLISQGLWDEARVFISDIKFGEGIEAAHIDMPYKEELIDTDRLLVYRNKK